MLAKIPTTPRSLSEYRSIVGEGRLKELRELASPLAGLRILHLTTTAFGAGVPEEVAAIVPLMNDLGLNAEWQVVRSNVDSARVNRAVENGLGGMDVHWHQGMADIWQRHATMNAKLFDKSYDFVIVHDPLPAGIPSALGERRNSIGRWIWHCHLDLTSARREIWHALRSYLDCCYEAVIFPAASYVRRDFDVPIIAVISPAIDPLNPKNIPIDVATQRHVLERYGIDPGRPIICQIARFVKRSDPLGVVDAFRLVKQHTPGLQLILVSALPAANTEIWQYFQRIAARAGDDPDIHLLSNLNEVGNLEQNVFQRAARVVLHRSQRRGFATPVADASWKGRPVVVDHRGVMPEQVVEGQTGYIVDTVADMGERTARLLDDPELADKLGMAGHEHVRSHFLITGTVADYLKLFGKLAERSSGQAG